MSPSPCLVGLSKTPPLFKRLSKMAFGRLDNLFITILEKIYYRWDNEWPSQFRRIFAKCLPRFWSVCVLFQMGEIHRHPSHRHHRHIHRLHGISMHRAVLVQVRHGYKWFGGIFIKVCRKISLAKFSLQWCSPISAVFVMHVFEARALACYKKNPKGTRRQS